jgi:hypothetical protein
MLLQEIKSLSPGLANWNDHSATIAQLIDQRLWDVLGGAGYDDGIEGSILRPSFISVADKNSDIIVPKSVEISHGAARQGFDYFDGINMAY